MTKESEGSRQMSALEEARKRLILCQDSRNIDSCLKCREVLQCQTRDNFVDKVYESMHKGKEGGFDFDA